MDIRVAQKEDINNWNEFVETNANGSFLQTWEWAQVQDNLKVPYWQYILEDEQGFKAVCLVVKRILPFGLSWLYVPRGPVVKDKSVWPLLEKKLEALAVQEKAMFVRIDPVITKQDVLSKNWQKATREVQPKNTLITNLNIPLEDIMSNMHSKTRYNIRLAKRKGVKISFSQNIKDLDKFWNLAQAVSSRSGFQFHPKEYYEAILKVLMPAKKAEIALAEYEGKALAVHILIKSGETVTYAHGASSSQDRNVMAPYLLQWETMKRAKEAGFKYYDWFGIAASGSGKEHSWFGITKFKTGFGGQRVEYIGAYDLVKMPVMYKVFNIVRKVFKKN